MSQMCDETQIRALHDDLVSLYEPVDRVAEHGADPTADPGEGVRQLVTTILSQNVADQNTTRAAEALFNRYDDFAAIEAADHEELKETIRVAGLANQKARRIQRSLAAIREETGGAYSLAFLDAMPTAEAKDWLTDIKGVGPKTASVVLNFHFGKPTMAVDTHVERVSKRFGLVSESASNGRAHDILDELVPDELIYPLHVLLIRHGRTYCSARSPDCDNPVCERYCECEGCAPTSGD
ncbi:endonuclease III domain-containing protein [Halalkalirubrum salinum]|uniref:endonuclease III domain-containing protein n=1 Tax=Halalkalirubrum salinum TaxID=2563889 RepID=UPI0010FBB324|nr:endonuclease III [Halalkalirubrum salinum]